MKFINYLESITGVSVYPLTSLLIFFIIFITLSVWAIKVSKTYITNMKEMPLNDELNIDQK